MNDKEYFVFPCRSCNLVRSIRHESHDSFKKGSARKKELESFASALDGKFSLEEAWKMKQCRCFVGSVEDSVVKVVQTVADNSIDNSKKECNFR